MECNTFTAPFNLTPSHTAIQFLLLLKHFLITRFNVKEAGWDTTKNGEPVLTADWLQHRFGLFEKYCLPSVLNQSIKTFTWCIFFDADTPGIFKDRINEISRTCSFLHPIYIKDATEQQHSLVKFIRSRLTADDEFVITSRLDNDDLIHRDYIRTVQELFPAEKAVIDLTKGYQMIIEIGAAELRKTRSSLNPFLSVVEHRENMETAISKKHSEWKSSHPIVEYSKSEMWMVLIHDKNKLNRPDSTAKKVHKIATEEFGLRTTPNLAASRWHLFIYNFLLEIKNFLRRMRKAF